MLRKMEGEWFGRKCVKWSGEVDVRTCWIFFEPASWRRIVGHFVAALRSRWGRAAQEVGVLYSLGA